MTAHPGRRVTGLCCLAAGVLPLIAVANPALFDVWTAEPAQALGIEAAHHGAWLFTTWVLAAGFGASIPAVVALAGLLDGVAVRVAAAVHLIGAGLLTVTTVFGVTAHADLIGKPIPDWYLPIDKWLDGLDTTVLGLFWPVAQLLFGLVIVRTRALPAWAGWVPVVAGGVVLAQLVAFGGVIPAPMFIAWVVLGVAGLAGARPARRPIQVAS
ncbi:hypothetical protein [Actinoplanes subtropicus]|uniref:hypothetical protein n=1 Tax=Actinoplanes subtropicus TaxID=543632 RepID=UPI0004C342A9|nr:hypothetical protein [Actinoplanes subtropicus]